MRTFLTRGMEIYGLEKVIHILRDAFSRRALHMVDW